MPVVPDAVIVHPLVLLSVVDHYNRVAQNTKKRVVGVLPGRWENNTVIVSNSYAGRPVDAFLVALLIPAQFSSAL